MESLYFDVFPASENTLGVVSLHRLHDLPEVLRWIPGTQKDHCAETQLHLPNSLAHVQVGQEKHCRY